CAVADSAGGCLEDADLVVDPVLQGSGPDGPRSRFPDAGNTASGEGRILLLWERRVLLCREAPTGQPQHARTLRNGESHLRGPNGAGSPAGGISSSRGIGRGQFAHGMELASWVGTYAVRRSGDLIDGNGDVRSAGLSGDLRVQGYVAVYKVVRQHFHCELATRQRHSPRHCPSWATPRSYRNLRSGLGFICLAVELWATRAAASDVSALERSG